MVPGDLNEAEWLSNLAKHRPRVARALLEAAERRSQALEKWGPEGARLTGLEELLCHLDAVAAALDGGAREDRLIASFCARSARDFETALEAGNSGYFPVASDAMRDVMEMTDLLLMFSLDITLAVQWLDTPPETHWRSFAPAAVRRYLHKNGVKYRDSARASIDYQGHSAALHVSPSGSAIAARGLAVRLPFLDDGHFWEIFSHGRELVFALDRLRGARGYSWPTVKAAPDLKDLAKAYEKSKEMESVFLALMQQLAPPGAEEA